MPVYQYCCPECEKQVEEYRSIETRHEGPLCSCGSRMDKVISAPSMVMPDIKPYRAVAGDRRWITSRSQHRQFLRDNGLVEVGNEGRPPTHE